MGQANAPAARTTRTKKKTKEPCSHLCGMLGPTGAPTVHSSSASRGVAADDAEEVQALLGSQQGERSRGRTSTSSTKDSARDITHSSKIFSSQLRATLQNRPPAEDRWLQAKSEWEKSVVAQIEAEARRAEEQEAAMCRKMEASSEVPPLDSSEAEGRVQHGTSAADGDREEERRAALQLIALEQTQDNPQQPSQEESPDELQQSMAVPVRDELPQTALQEPLEKLQPAEADENQRCSSSPPLLPIESE